MMDKLTKEEKQKIILSLISEHYKFDIGPVQEDFELADLIIKICEEKKNG